MSIDAKLKQLQNYPAQAPEAFRRQLEAAKMGLPQDSALGGGVMETSNRGIDRSRELSPIIRPTIVRTRVGV